jgi:hypothetical protein
MKINRMNNAILLHHLGYADLFSCNGLVNYYSETRENLKILVDTYDKKEILDYMYSHLSQVSCELAEISTEKNFDETCLICHTTNKIMRCPKGDRHCNYVDWSKYSPDEIIKIGAFNRYSLWENFLNSEQNISFSHSFYRYNNINIEYRINKFSINRDITKEEEIFKNYTSIITDEYTVIHDDSRRNIRINPSYIKTKNIYNLDGKSKTFLDQIKIIENAKEIHFIDSSYSVLIYFLSFHYQKIREIPKFLHLYPRSSRDYKIYQNPEPENWYNIYG